VSTRRPAVREFDDERLWNYLEQNLDGFRRPATLGQFAGGQSNPTYLVSTPGAKYVLRKRPAGDLPAMAHRIDREFRVLSALQKTDVPVPSARLYCDDAEVIGTPFYLMDFVEGRVLTDPRLSSLNRESRRAVYESLIDTLARLHLVDYVECGLEDFGRKGGYFERQLRRLSDQYRSGATEIIESMDFLIDWVPRHLPDDDSTAIAHGDFRLGNVILNAKTSGVVAVLDWELATLGHPLADLAYCCVAFHLPAGTPHFDGLADVDLEAIGLPTEQELVNRYCARVGRPSIPGWNFYLAFSLFRLAAISKGIYRRGLDGNAAGGNPGIFLETARLLADRSRKLACAHSTESIRHVAPSRSGAVIGP
jgi:aminoglycoside phosphotransferase (APT) family kinase protein